MDRFLAVSGSFLSLCLAGALVFHVGAELRLIPGEARKRFPALAIGTIGAGAVFYLLCSYIYALNHDTVNPFQYEHILGIPLDGPVVRFLGGLLFSQYAVVSITLTFGSAALFVWFLYVFLQLFANRSDHNKLLFICFFSPAMFYLFRWPAVSAGLAAGMAVVFLAARRVLRGKEKPFFLNEWIGRATDGPARFLAYGVLGASGTLLALLHAVLEDDSFRAGWLPVAGVVAALATAQAALLAWPPQAEAIRRATKPRLLTKPRLFLCAASIGTAAIFWYRCFTVLIYRQLMGHSETILGRLYDLFINAGDAPWYLEIAKNGYTNIGEYARLIVFFPLYPLLIRIVNFIVPSDFISSLAVSCVCLAVGGVFMVKLLRKEYPDRWQYGMLLFLFAPMGQFFVMGFTESLFFMLTAMTLYFARQRRFLPACIAGFFVALTRSFGALLVVPVMYEMLLGTDDEDRTFRSVVRGIRPSMLQILLIPLGFFLYLCLNRVIQGDWFAFIAHQQAPPWYNTPAWIGENLSLNYGMGMEHQYLGRIIYWVQLSYFFIAGGALLYALKRRVRLSYVLYGALYTAMTYTSGWLISGGRYMACCLPLYLILPAVENKRARLLILLAAGGLSMLYTYLILQGQAIM